MTDNLENFHYNVLIANMHEIYNFLQKTTNKIDFDITLLKENYSKIIKIIKPVLPHLASECLENLKISNKDEWPSINQMYLENEKITVVIQINGKKEIQSNVIET